MMRVSSLFRRILVSIGPLLLLACTSTAVKKSSPDLAHIVILSTNDFHGALLPQILKSQESAGATPVEYEIGGAANLAGYVTALRKEYGSSLLWLDGGDQFQGTLESNLEEGAPVVRFFNKAGLDAAAIGNHEFDYGPVGPALDGDPQGALKERMKEARYRFLSANTRSEGDVDRLPLARRSAIFERGGIRVGVVGLTTAETPSTSFPTFIEGLRFDDLAQAALNEAARLRREGAEIVVGVGHVGADCGNRERKTGVWGPDDAQTPCDESDELSELLSRLPAGTLDAFVAGHVHEIVHNWISGVPVVGSFFRGRVIGLIHLQYDRAARRVVPEMTRIESPILICPHFFSNQGNCDGSSPAPEGGRGSLVPARIHGREVAPDQAVTDLLRPTFEKVAAMKERVVGTAGKLIPYLPEGETALGNLAADAIREASGADFALINFYGIRSSIDAGPITFGEIYTALPFDNQIIVVRVTGAELRKIVQVAESGARGFFPLSGLKVRLQSDQNASEPVDLDGDGKREAWERNRIIDLTQSNGAPIENDRFYTIAMPDFVAEGGDLMKWPLSQIPRERFGRPTGIMLRDALVASVTRQKVVNSEAQPLVSPAHPRIAFE